MILSWLRDLIRPICKRCDGKGGWVSGYYEPEYNECDCCNPGGDNNPDITRVWLWHWWIYAREERRFARWCEEEGRKMDAEERIPWPR